MTHNLHCKPQSHIHHRHDLATTAYEIHKAESIWYIYLDSDDNGESSLGILWFLLKVERMHSNHTQQSISKTAKSDSKDC